MKKTDNILLILLRAGLWKRKIDDWSLFPLSPEEWDEVFHLAVSQTVTGITFEGLQQLPEAYFPPELLLARWVACIDGIERRNCLMNDVLKEVSELFSQNGIRGILQKGQGIADFYEQPLMRECGDIDFYFPAKGEALLARRLMERQGCVLHHCPDGSFSFSYKTIIIEFHPELLDLFNPFRKAYRNSLIREYGFRSLKLESGKDTFSVLTPAPELNLLLLSSHIFKHLSGYGLGWRHFCDMARACYKLCPCCNADEMQQIFEKSGIGDWMRQLNTVLVTCLGLPVDRLPFPLQDDRISGKLLDIVVNGGNFGESLRRKKSFRTASFWRRKWQTGKAFGLHVRFSSTYAPSETFWMLIHFLLGQRHERLLL